MEINTEKKTMSKGMRQLLLAVLFVGMGLLLVLSTYTMFYRPMRENNKILSEERLKERMQLSTLIADVFPTMGVDDELTEVVTRALESRKKTWSSESVQVAGEIEKLRSDDALIAGLLTDTGYDTSDFKEIVKDPEATAICLGAVNHTLSGVDAELEKLGVSKLKEEIGALKGTVTTQTREDPETGETITETVIVGGLIPEAQAKKDSLQKQHDEVKGKLDALDEYLDKNGHKINAMYSRLEGAPKVYDVFAKMEAISAYVKANPQDNMFLTDTQQKLASFPGESKEEDDILFIMKIEAETGIRMQQVNYGQDYQLTQLSNGMLLCYEVYSIPYYATYQGVKNLIAYFNENDDFYASVYTLSMQYNSMNETIQGNIIILHYYLLEEGAEYIPPVIDEVIIPGIDGIFGDVTDNGTTNGPMSDYTPEQIEEWLESGMTLEQVRQKLTDEGYPETELLWILKKKYKTSDEIKGFLAIYGDRSVNYDNQMETLAYLQKIFPNTELETLIDIYNAEMPEDDANDVPDLEGGAEDDGESNDQVPAGKQSDYTMADVQQMLDSGKTPEEVRDELLIANGYDGIELAWILREECNTVEEASEFLASAAPGKYTTTEEICELFQCDQDQLMDVYLG